MKDTETPSEASPRGQTIEQLSAAFQKHLNQHGYSFQEAVTKRAVELNAGKSIDWGLFGTEIPVICRNKPVHIDLALTKRAHQSSEDNDYFLIGECKRVNPARGSWCFTKSRYGWSNNDSSSVQFDVVEFLGARRYRTTTKSAYIQKSIYSLGLEVKTGDKGDSGGAGPAINEAVAQVLRSSNGFINYVGNSERDVEVLRPNIKTRIIPVIFTTAKLFSTEADLGSASLENGFLPENTVDLVEVPWLWFNHNRSPDLSHAVQFDHADAKEKHMRRGFREFTRSIAIVSPSGLDSFLAEDFSTWLF